MSNEKTRDITIRSVSIKSYEKLKMLKIILSMQEKQDMLLGEVLSNIIDAAFANYKDKLLSELLNEVN